MTRFVSFKVGWREKQRKGKGGSDTCQKIDFYTILAFRIMLKFQYLKNKINPNRMEDFRSI